MQSTIIALKANCLFNFTSARTLSLFSLTILRHFESEYIKTPTITTLIMKSNVHTIPKLSNTYSYQTKTFTRQFYLKMKKSPRRKTGR